MVMCRFHFLSTFFRSRSCRESSASCLLNRLSASKSWQMLTEDPVSLLSSVKLVFEPPQGVRAHLLRLLQQLETETASAAASRVQAAALAWYRLCFFHAIVVERCRRGRLG